MEITVVVKRLREGARLPSYGSSGAAGLDLYLCSNDVIDIPAGSTMRISTGVAVAIPKAMWD